MHYVRFPLPSCVKDHYNGKPFEACPYCGPCTIRYQGTNRVCTFINLCFIVCVCICFICSYILFTSLHLQCNMLDYVDPPVALHSIDGTTRCHVKLCIGVYVGVLHPCVSVYE